MKMHGGTRAEQLVRKIVENSILAVQPSTLFSSSFRFEEDELYAFGIRAHLAGKGSVKCVAIGKSAEAMALEVRRRLGDRVTGIVATPVKRHLDLRGFDFYKTGHPLPDEESVKAGNAVRHLVAGSAGSDLLLFLISGGGSASIFVPAEGVTLADANRLVGVMFDDGIPISKVNLVRRHLSELGGGKLAALAPEQRKISLVMSDVVGDRLSTIAGGPTVNDETSPADAVRFLETSGIAGKVPETIPAALMRQTGRPTRKIENADVRIIGSNRDALEAAEKAGVENGFDTVVLTRFWESSAEAAAGAVVSVARSTELDSMPLSPPALVLAAGETTVKVSGDGTGGRNQQMVLCALRELGNLAEKGTPLKRTVVFSFGTDGKDGNSDAAGAYASLETLAKVPGGIVEIEDCICRNDSNSFFRKYGGLIETGPTDTNVMDMFGIVVA